MNEQVEQMGTPPTASTLPEFGFWPGRHLERVFLITGASGGLGSAAAERLSREGAIIVGADVRAAELPPEAEGMFRVLDVTSPEQWKKLVDETLQKYGRIDGALFCHGVQGPEFPVEDVPLDGWQRTLDINLTGCFNGLQAVVPAMKSARYGRIAMLSSIAGREGNENMTAYSVAKAGLITLGKSVAKETAKYGITINSIAPSMFQTPLLKDLSPERNAALLSRVPMGRIGYPAEFAALASWLLSVEASYMTGQTLDLSGGRSVS